MQNHFIYDKTLLSQGSVLDIELIESKRFVKELMRHHIALRLQEVQNSPSATASRESGTKGICHPKVSKTVSKPNHPARPTGSNIPRIKSWNDSAYNPGRDTTLAWKKALQEQGYSLSSMNWVAYLEVIAPDTNGGKVQLPLGVTYRIGLTTCPSNYEQGVVIVNSTDYAEIRKLIRPMQFHGLVKKWLINQGFQDPVLIANGLGTYHILPL